MPKKIIVAKCSDCVYRCNASLRAWRNIYCEEKDCRSISEKDDEKGFPKWCPLPEEEVIMEV